MPAPTMMIFKPCEAEPLVLFVRSWSAMVASDVFETGLAKSRSDRRSLTRSPDHLQQIPG